MSTVQYPNPNWVSELSGSVEAAASDLARHPEAPLFKYPRTNHLPWFFNLGRCQSMPILG